GLTALITNTQGGNETLSVADFSVVSVATPNPVAVPNVVGATQVTATGAIAGVGLRVGMITTTSDPTTPAGSVSSENPIAGTMVSLGSAVNLVLSGSQPISVGPSSGTAGRQLFTFVARDANGANSIQYAQFLFSKAGLSAVNGC